MKKSILIIGVLALASFAACQKNVEVDVPVQEPVQIAKTTYSLTVSASKGLATKGLDEYSSIIEATWKVGDKVAVYAAGTSVRIGTLMPETTGASESQLSGEITGTFAVGDKLDLLFVGQEGATPRTWTYEGQKGTLQDIADNFDFSKAQVSVESVGVESLVASDAAFESQQAIVKFTLKNGDNTLPVHTLNISATSGKLVTGFKAVGGVFTPTYGNLEITLDGTDPSNVFYVALRNNKGSADEYTLTTSSGATNYYYTKSGISFDDGTYRTISIKMKTDENVYTVAGTPADIFGTDWNEQLNENNMVRQSDGTYRKEYSLDVLNGAATQVSFKVVKNHVWSTAYPTDDNYGVSVGAGVSGKLIITFNPTGTAVNAWIDETHSYTVVGSKKSDDTDGSIFGQPWDVTATDNDMALMENGTYLKTYMVDGDEGEIKFKIAKDHQALSVNGWPESDKEFTINKSGILNIAFQTDEPNEVDAWMNDPVYTLAGTFSSWQVQSEYDMEKQDDGTYKFSIDNVSSSTIEFKVVRNRDWKWNWGANGAFKGSNISYTVTTPCDLVFTFDPATGVTTVEESRVTLYFYSATAVDETTGHGACFHCNSLGTSWPGLDFPSSEVIADKKFYIIQWPSSLIWDKTLTLYFVNRDKWNTKTSSPTPISFTGKKSAYYFRVAQNEDIVMISESEARWTYTSHYTSEGVNWNNGSWLPSSTPSYISKWKVTSNASNIYILYVLSKTQVDEMQDDRYFYTAFDTGATGGTDFGNGIGGIKGTYNALSLVFPFKTQDEKVVCVNGVEVYGWVKNPANATSSLGHLETYGVIKTDAAYVEIKVPRSMIGAPNSGSIGIDNSYRYSTTGKQSVTLYTVETD